TCRRCRRAPRAHTDPRLPPRPFGGFSLRRRAYAPMPAPAGLPEDALERLLPDPERLRQLRVPDRQWNEDPDDVGVGPGAEEQQPVAERLVADGRDELWRGILRL